MIAVMWRHKGRGKVGDNGELLGVEGKRCGGQWVWVEMEGQDKHGKGHH